jgi:hypothetical protein
MEIKVTVELGPQTFALINGFSASTTKTAVTEEVAPLVEKPKQPRTRATAKVEPVQEEAPKEVAAPVEEAPTKSETFADLDDDAKLDAIKAEVTKHTKKGKSADIKALLGGFDANRASELAPEDYDAFYDGVKRYGAGESVDDIIGLD